jgi:hypothetical protein
MANRLLDGIIQSVSDVASVLFDARSDASVTGIPTGRRRLYYSTTQNDVVTKDSSGTIKPLGGQSLGSRFTLFSRRPLFDVVGALIQDLGDRVRLDLGRIDAREYLARDGITDTTTGNCATAIEDAINAAAAAGVWCKLPPGEIRLERPITVTGTGLMGIKGHWLGTSLRAYHSGNHTVCVQGNPYLLLHDVRIRAGSGAGNGAKSALLIDCALQIYSHFRNVSLIEGKTWGSLTVANGGSMLGCKFHNTHIASINAGVYAQDASAFQATDWYGGRIASCSGPAFYLRNRSTGKPEITFHGVIFEGNSYENLNLQGGMKLTFLGGHAESSGADDGTNTIAEILMAGAMCGSLGFPATGTGTSPPAVKIRGERSVDKTFTSILLDVNVGGALGTATFSYSLDGGATWVGPQKTSAQARIGQSGYIAEFSAGTYNADNAYSYSAPSVTLDGYVVGSGTLGNPTKAEIQILAAGTLSTASYRWRVCGDTNAPADTWTAWQTDMASAGTTPPVVYLTGDSAGGFSILQLKMIAGGARGTATFQYSTDGGSTWSGTLTTAATVSLGATGYTANFPTGTYNVNNTYTTANMSAGTYSLVNGISVTFSAGTYVVGTYECVVQSGTCAISEFGLRRGVPLNFGAPRVDFKGPYCHFAAHDSEFISSDYITGRSDGGSGVGSMVSLVSCQIMPKVSVPALSRIHEFPLRAGTVNMATSNYSECIATIPNTANRPESDDLFSVGFNVEPYSTTTLSSAISSTSATSAVVTSTAGMPIAGLPGTPFKIKCENEVMLVTANPSGTTLTVTRGQDGTAAATHAVNKAVTCGTPVVAAGAVEGVRVIRKFTRTTGVSPTPFTKIVFATPVDPGANVNLMINYFLYRIGN